MPVRLPGGRGDLEGQNSEQIRDEQFRSRQQQQSPRGDYWVTCGAHPFQDGPTAGANLGLNQPHFIPIGHIPRGVRVAFGRVSVVTASAGGKLEVALYRMDDQQKLWQVPNTRVVFPTDNVGPVEKELEKEVDLGPDQYLWMGHVCDDAVPRFHGVDVSPRTPLYGRYLNSTTALPAAIDLSGTLGSDQTSYATVVYISREAQKVL